MTDDQEVTCPNCGEVDPDELFDCSSSGTADRVTDVADAAGCTECYMNDDCPAGCNHPHDEPDDPFDCDGMWTCPTHQVNYVYENGEWRERERYDDDPQYVDEACEWYCDPSSWGWGRCGHCDGWVHEDDTYWGENFRYCSRDHARASNDLDWEDSENGDSNTAPTCGLCRKSLAGSAFLFDGDTERTFCANHDGPPRGAVLVAA